jgi:hypothetical protein
MAFVVGPGPTSVGGCGGMRRFDLQAGAEHTEPTLSAIPFRNKDTPVAACFPSARTTTFSRASLGLALLLSCVSAPNASVAASCPGWQSRTGTAQDDEVRAAVQDDAGNVYLAGFENGFLGLNDYWPIGDVRGFVEKRAADGSLLWRHLFDTPGIDIVEALGFDPLQRRVIVAGRTDGALKGTNQGSLDLFLAALDEDGTVMALDQFGDIYPQHPTGLAITPSGDVVVAGFDDTYVEGNAVLGQPTMFVARYGYADETGATFVQRWQRMPNEPGPLTSRSFAFAAATIDGAEDVAVAIQSSDRTQGGARVVLWDKDGAEVWNRQVSAFSLDSVFALATQPGRLLIGGTTVIPLAGPPLGNSDAFIMELDPATGDARWGQQFGSAGAEWLSSLALGPDGVVYASGLGNGAVVPGAVAASNSVFVLSFAPNGKPLSGWQSGALSPYDFIDAMHALPLCGDQVLVAGHSSDLPETTPLRTDAVAFAVTLHGLDDAIFGNGFE